LRYLQYSIRNLSRVDEIQTIKRSHGDKTNQHFRPYLPHHQNGTTRFVLDCRILGQSKLVWRSSIDDARAAENKAINEITEGQGEVLNLKSADAPAPIHITAPASLPLEIPTVQKLRLENLHEVIARTGQDRGEIHQRRPA
jgi:hypothetical protein